MKVGVIGSGGREHAICYYLSKSKIVNKVFVFLEMLEQTK